MWFIIALLSFFLLAVAAVADKFLLTKSPLVPVSFAFLVSFLGGLASSFLILFEPNFYFPAKQFLTIILAGGGFYFALYFMYLAVVKQEVSRVNPTINSLTPVFIYVIAIILSLEFLSLRKLIGSLIVISGSYLLSQVGIKKTRLDKRAIVLIILAALMFAVSNIFSKVAYNQLPFLTAFVWIRWLTLAVALFFTTVIWGWPKILSNSQEAKVAKHQVKNPWPVLIIGQLSGAVAVILFQYAIKLGSVTIVTVLQGLQYFFLLLLMIVLSKRFPQVLREDINSLVIKRKAFYCLILAAGVILVLV